MPLHGFVREHWIETALLVGFVLLSSLYSLISPVFEVSDEFWHYPVIHHIATTGALPVQEIGRETTWEQQGSQPPLYYLLAAAMTSWIDTSDMLEVRWQNPHAKVGIPGDFDNKNMVIHTEAERFPWRGTVLAIHIIRFFGVLLGATTVFLAFLLSREMFPHEVWIHRLTMALCAFNPMFLHISGSVNNDNLTVTLSTWVTLIVARMVRHGLSARRIATLAIVAAFASITKISGATFMVLAVAGLATNGLQTRNWRRMLITGLVLVGTWCLLAGWWYLRNIQLYGELLGIETHIAIAGGRSISLVDLISTEWYGFWVGYWGWFGGVTIAGPPWLYVVYAVLFLAGIGGFISWLRHTVATKNWMALLVPGLMIVQIAVVFSSFIRWTMMTYASQGRLMFPVIGPTSALVALGIIWLSPLNYRPLTMGLVAGLMGTIAFLIPFWLIAPAYDLPPSVALVPESAQRESIVWNELELVGIAIEDVTAEAGDYVPVTLYLRLLGPTNQDYSLALTLLGRDLEVVGKIDTYPGGGTLPTSRMMPDVIVADSYLIPTQQATRTPTAIRLQLGAGLVQANGDYMRIGASDDDESSLADRLIDTGVLYPFRMAGCGTSSSVIIHHRVGDFASVVPTLSDNLARPGAEIVLSLEWMPLHPTPQPYTVFVHLLDRTGALVAQADAPPLNGDYVTTQWRRPCVFKDTYRLRIPADAATGDYVVVFGMYDPTSPNLGRIPVFALDGAPHENSAIPAGSIRVEGQ